MNKYLILFLLAMAMNGCTTQVYAPKAQDVDDERIPTLIVTGPVSVTGMDGQRVKFLVGLSSVDYQLIAESARTMLAAELEQRTSPTLGAEQKSLALFVWDVSIVSNDQVFLNFTVETGDGYLRGFQATGKNWQYLKAVDTAIADMIVQVLSDTHVQEYLAG